MNQAVMSAIFLLFISNQVSAMPCGNRISCSSVYLCADHLDDSRSSKPAPLTSKQIQMRLNAQFRSIDWATKAASVLFGIRNIFAPFKVSEQKDLLPGGRMPPTVSSREVIVVRKTRDEGLEEMRKALDFPEERSWLFVPHHNLWIYTSINFADRNHVQVNGLLREAAVREWGRIEDFHTHPWAAMEVFKEEIANLMQKRGASREVMAMLYLGRPSIEDQMNLITRRAKEPVFSRPPYDSYIVHPFGLTFYSVTVGVQKHQDGSTNAIYPALLGWDLDDIELARRQNSAESGLRKMIETQVKKSNEQLTSIFDNLNIPRDEHPHIIVRFQAWDEL